MKIVVRLVAAVVILMLVAAVVAILSLDGVARRIVETEGSKAVGTKVALEGISIRPIAGRATIAGLSVANPKGYESESILDIHHGEVSVRLGSLLSDQPEIPVIEVDGVSVVIEQKIGGSNLQDLLDGMKTSSKTDSKTSGDQQRFKVDRLAIRDVNVNAQILPIGGKATDLKFTIEKIEIDRLDERNTEGLLMNELVGTIVGSVLGAVVHQLTIEAPGQLVAGLGGAIEALDLPKATMSIGNSVVDLGGGLVNAAEEGVEGVGEAIEGIGKSFEDAFGGGSP